MLVETVLQRSHAPATHARRSGSPMTTAIAIPLSEPTMATARMSKQMRLDLGPPALTIRDVDPDAIDLVLKLFIDDLNEAELCQAEILKICIALRLLSEGILRCTAIHCA